MKEIIKNINDYEILTPSGWSNISGIRKLQKGFYYIISFDDDSILKCSDDHLIKMDDNKFIYSKDIEVNDITCNSKKVVSIQLINRNIDVYDIMNVELKNEYYTNNVISHNCGNFFEMKYSEAINGTEGSFNPIKLHWKMHPDRDQAWRDKQDVELGTRLAAQECLHGDTIVTIKDKKTNKIFDISLSELHKKSYNQYEILTPNGFKTFDNIKQNIKTNTICIELENNDYIISSLSHPHITIDGKIKQAKDFKINEYLDTKKGKSKIVDISIKNKDEILYDIINVSDGNIFYANDIVTHNCDADFVTSGQTIVPGAIFEWYQKNHVCDPIEKRMFENDLWIWKYSQAGRNYLISADVARGDGGDYSAFHVIDLETYEQVAEFKSKIGTTEYGNLLCNIGYEYNNAFLIVENASMGWSVLQTIIERNYPNLYYTQKESNIQDAKKYMSKNYDLTDKNRMVPGFTTSSKSRPIMINKLALELEAKDFIIHSERLIHELFTFHWIKGKPVAISGKNDDLVLSLAIGIFIRNTVLILQKQGLELTKSAIKSIKTGRSSGVYSSVNNIDNPYIMKTKYGEMDLKKWL